MNRKSIITILFLLFVIQSIAQDASGLTLVEALNQKAADGQLKAIRDLGSLLEGDSDKKVKEAIQKRLLVKNATLQSFKNFQREAFLDFFYGNEKAFEYSPVLKAFYVSPLEEWDLPKVQISPLNGNAPSIIQLVKQFQQADKVSSTSLEQIALKNTAKAIATIQDLLKKGAIDKKAFIDLIQKTSNERVFDLIVEEVSERRLDTETASKVLSQLSLSNLLEIGPLVIKKSAAGSFKALRLKGFEERIGLSSNSFGEKVDFFALIVSESPSKSTLWNAALTDMIATKHPRLLFYLKCNAYLAKQEGEIALSNKLEQYIKWLVRLDIQVEGDEKQALVYWAKNYKHYDWDEKAGVFINKKITKQLHKSYERLFRRLSAKDGDVAMNAYQQLTKGTPSQVLKLNRKYKNVLRSVHPALPSFRHGFLEQLVRLTHLAKTNGLSVEISPPLLADIQELKESLKPRKRYAIENKLIAQLRIEESFVLEYEALLHSNNLAFNYSISRILEAHYSKYLVGITQDRQALEQYLSKAMILSDIGVLGTCNAYLNRLDFKNEQIRAKIQSVQANTVNEVLLQQIQKWLAPEESIKLPDNFWESVEKFSAVELKRLPYPDDDELKGLINLLFRSEEALKIRNWMVYLKLNSQLDYVPYLMELLGQEGFPEADLKQQMAIQILETIYQFSYKEKGQKRIDTQTNWLGLWQKDKANYKTWAKFFYELQIQQLRTASSIDIKVLNNTFQSDFFSTTHRSTILDAIQKLTKKEKVTRLKSKPKLTYSEAQKHLGTISFSYKKLDDIFKIVQTESASEWMLFLKDKMHTYTPFEKGYVYNKLFKQSWFQNYALEASNEWKEEASTLLEAFLEASDFLGEYEEFQLYWRLFALKHSSESFDSQIKTLNEEALPNGAKSLILKDLLSRVKYEELGAIFKHYDLMETIDKDFVTGFLSRDFGLPLFDLGDIASRNAFLEEHEKLSKSEFYKKVLSDFGLDFLSKKGKVDFNKIKRILNTDAIEAFSSINGGKRDYYVYGIIKILEMHFGTRLGFHEKLNENQLFYTYTSQKRAEAWIRYLEENKLASAP